MTDRNYQMILQQIFVDCSKIQKIDVNFASPKRMQGHPYLPPKALNRILKFRQLKGGWSDTGDLIEQHILSAEEPNGWNRISASGRISPERSIENRILNCLRQKIYRP